MKAKLPSEAYPLVGLVTDLVVAEVVQVPVSAVVAARRRAALPEYPHGQDGVPEWLLSQRCRSCNAEPGDVCQSPLGTKYEVDFHVERVADAWAALTAAPAGPAVLEHGEMSKPVTMNDVLQAGTWRNVMCPTCGAKQGEECTDQELAEGAVHGVRLWAAKNAESGVARDTRTTCRDCGCLRVEGEPCLACADEDRVETAPELLVAEVAEPDPDPVETVTTMDLAAIRTDGGTQARVAVSPETVAAYQECLDDLPPVLVYRDGDDFYLVDGYHRLAAHKAAGRTTIRAEVRVGTLAEARWEALAVNTRHGLRLTNADKRRAVLIALELRPEASNREIAKQCGCTHPFVAGVRAEKEAGEEPEPEYLWPTQKAAQKEWVNQQCEEGPLLAMLKSPTVAADIARHAEKRISTLGEIARADTDKVLRMFLWWTAHDDNHPLWPLVLAKLEALATQQSKVDALVVDTTVATRPEVERILSNRGLSDALKRKLLHTWAATEALEGSWYMHLESAVSAGRITTALRLLMEHRLAEHKKEQEAAAQRSQGWSAWQLQNEPDEIWLQACQDHPDRGYDILKRAFAENKSDNVINAALTAMNLSRADMTACAHRQCGQVYLGDRCWKCHRTAVEAKAVWDQAVAHAWQILKLEHPNKSLLVQDA